MLEKFLQTIQNSSPEGLSLLTPLRLSPKIDSRGNWEVQGAYGNFLMKTFPSCFWHENILQTKY